MFSPSTSALPRMHVTAIEPQQLGGLLAKLCAFSPMSLYTGFLVPVMVCAAAVRNAARGAGEQDEYSATARRWPDSCCHKQQHHSCTSQRSAAGKAAHMHSLSCCCVSRCLFELLWLSNSDLSTAKLCASKLTRKSCSWPSSCKCNLPCTHVTRNNVTNLG